MSAFAFLTARNTPSAFAFFGGAQPPRLALVVVERVEEAKPAKVEPRHWPKCNICDREFSTFVVPKRWYGLCSDCHSTATKQSKKWNNNITQRWRKASVTGFMKTDTSETLVFVREPSPLQIFLLRLAENVGVSTRPGTKGSLCEGLETRLGMDPDDIGDCIRGTKRLTPWARAVLVRDGLKWLKELDKHRRDMHAIFGDENEQVDPDSPDVLAIAAALRRELGSASTR